MYTKTVFRQSISSKKILIILLEIENIYARKLKTHVSDKSFRLLGML